MKILFTDFFCVGVSLMAADQEKPLPEDYKSIKALAENGDARAQLEAGNCLRWGYGGVEKDLKAALAWYLKAAEQGHAEAQFKLGDVYQFGGGVDRDLKEAFKWFRKAAEQGHAAAQNSIGSHFFTQGPDKNKEAIKWFRKAAEQGHPGAQFNLGTAYMSASGVKGNQAEAIKWWRRAAEKSDAMSQAQLGKLYWKGGPVPEDKVRAFAWFSLAARNAAMEGMFDVIEGDLPGKAQINQAMTPEQITKAQALIKEMIKKNPKLIKLSPASL